MVIQLYLEQQKQILYGYLLLVNKQWGLVNILQNQQTIIKELNISWSYCIACACVLEEAGQFSLIKWLDKQSNGHSIKFMSQNKVTDENGVWFSFIGIGKY